MIIIVTIKNPNCNLNLSLSLFPQNIINNQDKTNNPLVAKPKVDAGLQPFILIIKKPSTDKIAFHGRSDPIPYNKNIM